MAKSRFSTTRWSVVHRAGGPRSPEARAALEELCARYWYPLYAFLRRSGSRPDEAADLVQGLFASLIERESLTAVDHEMGRFRSWLLGALKHHVVDARKHDAALKRGGGEKDATRASDGNEIEKHAICTRRGRGERKSPDTWKLWIGNRMQVHVVPKSGVDGKKVNFFGMTQGDVLPTEKPTMFEDWPEVPEYGSRGASLQPARLP